MPSIILNQHDAARIMDKRALHLEAAKAGSCPYEVPSLKVREPWAESHGTTRYAGRDTSIRGPWKSGATMKLEHARVELLVKKAVLVRLWDVGAEGLELEGYSRDESGFWRPVPTTEFRTWDRAMRFVWDQRKPKTPFDENPLVWQVHFTPTEIR